MRKALRGYEGLVVDARADNEFLSAAARPESGEAVNAGEVGEGPTGAAPTAIEPRYLDRGRIQVIAADGIRPPWKPGSFDRVLLDCALHRASVRSAAARKPAGARRRGTSPN